MTGYITKGIGGFYYVKTSEGIVECKPRGIFRKQKITPVRQAEALCKKLAKPAKEPVAAPLPSALPVEVEESLKQALGSEVRVAYHDGKGKLTVHFYSDDQLKAFANLLGQYSVE